MHPSPNPFCITPPLAPPAFFYSIVNVAAATSLGDCPIQMQISVLSVGSKQDQVEWHPYSYRVTLITSADVMFMFQHSIADVSTQQALPISANLIGGQALHVQKRLLACYVL